MAAARVGTDGKTVTVTIYMETKIGHTATDVINYFNPHAT